MLVVITEQYWRSDLFNSWARGGLSPSKTSSYPLLPPFPRIRKNDFPPGRVCSHFWHTIPIFLSLTSRLNSCLLGLLTTRTHRLVDLGIDQYFHTKFSYIAHRGSNYTTELPLPVVAITHGTRRQWKKALQELGKVQKLVSAGSGLLIPCVLIFNEIKSHWLS